MTQRHYLESVSDDQALDPQFKSLLRHHWMEEAQHAKLDTLMVEALAEAAGRREIDARGRRLPRDRRASSTAGSAAGRVRPRRARAGDGPALGREEREPFLSAPSATPSAGPILGSGMTHPNFLRDARRDPAGRARPHRVGRAHLRLGREPSWRTGITTAVEDCGPGRFPATEDDGDDDEDAAVTRPRRINGIDLAALDEVVEQAAEDPAKAVVEFRVKSEWQGQTRTRSTVDSYTIGGAAVQAPLHDRRRRAARAARRRTPRRARRSS